MQKMFRELRDIQKIARALHLRLSILQAECARQKKWEKVAGRSWR